ncbi:hypothetical protein [Streptomyces sp. SLBN-31]|uniref:hypothetical protein n=1 Tax=Streptomyces sp. SLBN-31 TaxID=2768444 RepID=UPI001153F6E8|nr:hypothetical protein [Streptomyces sp. SLBN-31]
MAGSAHAMSPLFDGPPEGRIGHDAFVAYLRERILRHLGLEPGRQIAVEDAVGVRLTAFGAASQHHAVKRASGDAVRVLTVGRTQRLRPAFPGQRAEVPLVDVLLAQPGHLALDVAAVAVFPGPGNIVHHIGELPGLRYGIPRHWTVLEAVVAHTGAQQELFRLVQPVLLLGSEVPYGSTGGFSGLWWSFFRGDDQAARGHTTERHREERPSFHSPLCHEHPAPFPSGPRSVPADQGIAVLVVRRRPERAEQTDSEQGLGLCRP